jgi:hypothetical protein
VTVASDTLQVLGKYDYVRVNVFMALVAGIAMQACACFAVAKPQAFSLREFGEGVALILAAGAAAAWAKSKE